MTTRMNRKIKFTYQALENLIFKEGKSIEKYYDILGLSFDCTKEEIEKAYSGFLAFGILDDEIEEAYQYLKEWHDETRPISHEKMKGPNKRPDKEAIIVDPRPLVHSTDGNKTVERLSNNAQVKGNQKSRKKPVFIVAFCIVIFLVFAYIADYTEHNNSNNNTTTQRTNTNTQGNNSTTTQDASNNEEERSKLNNNQNQERLYEEYFIKHLEALDTEYNEFIRINGLWVENEYSYNDKFENSLTELRNHARKYNDYFSKPDVPSKYRSVDKAYSEAMDLLEEACQEWINGIWFYNYESMSYASDLINDQVIVLWIKSIELYNDII